MTACLSPVLRLCRLKTVVGRDSGVILGESKGLQLKLDKANISESCDTHTHTHTYQELLSVHKHMILGNVYTVPGQSQDQLIEGRCVCV